MRTAILALLLVASSPLSAIAAEDKNAGPPSGWLNLNTSRPSTIYLDDGIALRRLGETPIHVQLDAGSHRLVAIATSGTRSQRVRVEIQPNETNRYLVPLTQPDVESALTYERAAIRALVGGHAVEARKHLRACLDHAELAECRRMIVALPEPKARHRP
jgi:hypothetical protein